MPPILMRMGNARTHINYLVDIAANFILTSSNYTTQIEMDDLRDKYVQTMQSNRTFACFAKLKKDTKDKPVPAIDNTMVNYFVHNFKKPIYIDNVLNIDLKSAYATILFNDGFITEDTFNYVSKSAKKERLASVGMLAARKKIFTFKTGCVVDESEIVSEKSGFFFYAVMRTSEIMAELQKIAAKDYLYTWVDGIYFLPNDNVKWRCINYLADHKFNYTCDELEQFEVEFKRDNILVTFKKEGKRKIFNLPLPMTEFKRLMIDAILQANRKASANAVNQKYKDNHPHKKPKNKKDRIII